jgi:hypothetical protein
MNSRQPNFQYLLDLRHAIGPNYGSEDLCIFLFSLVKREKPKYVVELGTGLGVTTAWIAAAMCENGYGTVVTVDNGAHFSEASRLEERFALPPSLEDLAGLDYDKLLAKIFERSGVAAHVKIVRRDIDLMDMRWLDQSVGPSEDGNGAAPIDIVFSDFNHSAATVARIVGAFLPRLASVGSILIDSASTHLMSYYLLEHLCALLQRGKVPKEILDQVTDTNLRQRLFDHVANSEFHLMHLVEKQDRAQNSTAWLRVERASLVPPLAIALH